MSQSRFSRPAGSREPFSFTTKNKVVAKPVFIGQHNPGDHYATAAKVFIPHDELYQPRKR